jgi:ribosomal protein L29
MAVLKTKEIKNLSQKDRDSKLAELKLELVKANVTANKTNAKTKEIKKAISRILTLSKSPTDKSEQKPK